MDAPDVVNNNVPASYQPVKMSDGIELKNITHKGDDSPPPEYSNLEKKGLANPVFNSSADGLNSGVPHSQQGKTWDTTVSVEDIDPKVITENEGEDEEEEDYIDPPNGPALKIYQVRQSIEEVLADQKQIIIWVIIGALLILYAVYFGFAMAYEFGSEPSVRLLWVTALVVLCIILSITWTYCGESLMSAAKPCLNFCDVRGWIVLWVILILIYIAVLVFVFVDVFTVSEQPYNLVSLGGLVCYVLFCFIFSYSPAHVNWRAVLWGIAIQFICALLILRWDKGYIAFKWLGDRVSEFLAHSDFGAAFIFGEGFREHFFAFSVLPVIIYFSTAISMLYYLGVMQVVVQKVGWVLQMLLGTTAGESLNAAGNIFIGQSEAPLMIRPLIKDMTRSELHAIMTGGFATIAGSVLAAYISFGVPANHLISASVMSAPAALAMSKLFYPETQQSKTRAQDVLHMEPSKERNLIEAASAGASASIKLVANIAVNLIAFLALLKFINSTLCWFGLRIGWDDPCLSFELICSYLFLPLALIMGTELTDCRMVGELIGVKTFLNEFVAYERLGILVKNKEWLMGHALVNGSFAQIKEDIIVYDFLHPVKDIIVNNHTLARGILQDRSEVISTYALCGFANFGSMGIMLGALGAMAPSRKGDLSRVVLRAMIAGNVACFMTACIAGIFYQKNLDPIEEYVFNELNGVTM